MPPENQPVAVPIQDLEVQYPAIEKLIDSEDFNQINKNFTKVYKELEDMGKGGGLKKSGQTRKAMVALEKVMDLLREILKLKYQLMKWQEDEGKESKK